MTKENELRLALIEENQHKVYAAGKKAGAGDNMGTTETVTGNPVRLDYVHPTEHEISVRLENKNLFDISRVANNANELVNNGDGSITVNTTATSSSVAPYGGDRTLRYFAPGLEVGKTYMLSLSSTGSRHVYLNRSGTTWLSGSSVVMTEEMLNSMILFYASGVSTSATISNIQIEEGTTATAYTPHLTDFSDATIKQYGKNLFQSLAALKTQNELTFTPHDDGTLAIDGTASATTFYELGRINLVVGQVYRLSGGATGGSSKTYQLYLHGITTGTDVYEQGAGKTFTATDATYRVLVAVYAGATVEELLFKPMVVLGNNSGEYEPYVEPTQYTANADGTVKGIKSLSPVTTLVSDGANITAQYYVDAARAERGRFWSAVQDNGNRTDYNYGFYQWRVDAIDPQYDVRPTKTLNMLQSVVAYNGKNLSLPEIEARNGIKFDFSKTIDFGNWLYWGAIEDLGFVDTTSCPNPNLAGCSILKRLSIAIKADGSQNFSTAFNGDSGLEELTVVSGVFGGNLGLQWSPLSKDSILSVFNALSTTTTGLTVTFKKTAVEAAFTTEEWDALVATKTNWTIALA